MSYKSNLFCNVLFLVILMHIVLLLIIMNNEYIYMFNVFHIHYYVLPGVCLFIKGKVVRTQVFNAQTKDPVFIILLFEK